MLSVPSGLKTFHKSSPNIQNRGQFPQPVKHKSIISYRKERKMDISDTN
jgi:hypothetical protein